MIKIRLIGTGYKGKPRGSIISVTKVEKDYLVDKSNLAEVVPNTKPKLDIPPLDNEPTGAPKSTRRSSSKKSGKTNKKEEA